MSRRAFTLVELLVTLAIMVVLMSMLMPMLSLARRSSLRTATQAILSKTSAGLEQYKTDFGGYPFQLSYPTDGTWSNNLAYTIGTDISPDAAQAVKQDMTTARDAYRYDFSLAIQGWGPWYVGPQAFLENRGDGIPADNSIWPNDQWGNESDVLPSGFAQDPTTQLWYYQYPSYFRPTVVLLNRLGAERAEQLMLIGAVTTSGCYIQGFTPPPTTGLPTHPPRDLTGTRIVPNPVSLQPPCPAPGWAKDYLQGEVESKYISGTTLLDAYFHPLIYICQALPGVEQTWGNPQNNGVDINSPWQYGLQPQGRKTLQPFSPGTSSPLAADPNTLPDPTNLMHSDMRYWAPPGYEMGYELWSAGPDGQMSWWRDDPSNRDNIPAEPYNQLIGPMP